MALFFRSNPRRDTQIQLEESEGSDQEVGKAMMYRVQF